MDCKRPILVSSVQFPQYLGQLWTGCGPWLPISGAKNQTELNLQTLLPCNITLTTSSSPSPSLQNGGRLLYDSMYEVIVGTVATGKGAFHPGHIFTHVSELLNEPHNHDNNASHPSSSPLSSPQED